MKRNACSIYCRTEILKPLIGLVEIAATPGIRVTWEGGLAQAEVRRVDGGGWEKIEGLREMFVHFKAGEFPMVQYNQYLAVKKDADEEENEGET